MAKAPAPVAAAPSSANVMTQDVCAKLLMLTPQRISQLVKAGVIPREGPNAYPLVGSVQGYIGFLKDEEKRNSKSAAAGQVQAARARQIEFQTAREELKVVDTEEALAVCEDVLGALRAGLSAFPDELTRDINLRDKAEQIIDRILTEVSATFEQRAQALRSRGQIDAPAEEVAP